MDTKRLNAQSVSALMIASLCLLATAGSCWAHPVEAQRHTLAAHRVGAGRPVATAAGEIAQFRMSLNRPGALAPATTEQRRGAAGVVMAQLAAFRSGNFARAVRYQSPGLRASLGSVRQFRLMMSEVYPEITASQSVRFGSAESGGSGRYILLPATLTGQDGVSVQALFVLMSRPSGYRIMTVLGGMNPRPVRTARYDPRMA